MEEFELVIIGGGFAGLTASIFASERGLKTIVLTKNIGGQILLSDRVTNYPGFKEISGRELIENLYKQVKSRNVDVRIEEVKEIRNAEEKYLIKTDKNEYLTKAIIIASGKIPRKLGIPGEDRFSGKYLFYSFIPSLEELKGKKVAVIGGGNTALEVCLKASEYAEKVFIIHRRSEFRGFESLAQKIKDKKNVELVMNAIPKEIIGKEKIEKLILEKTKVEEGKVIPTGEKFELEIDYIFVCIGFVPSTGILESFVKMNEYKMVEIDKFCRTFDPKTEEIKQGVFAAGDITDTPFKQLTVAAGEGTKAALQAYLYIKGIKGGPVISSWHSK
ncbi:MAG: FAD-dependent oxidoreductase [Candidatus Aenigmarchaeota archaeon]|nr:FAD-dependent oxidoreductase [Candidatus Aenigmarchaeota archaeon]